MQLYPLKQVTIVTEKILQDQLLPKLKELGAGGYTVSDCSGDGERGLRSGVGYGSNIQIIIICPEEVAHKILTHVSRNFFENYSCIAWIADVQVMRGARYVKKP